MPEGNGLYSSKDGILYNSSGETLIKCPEGKAADLTLPEGVKTIGVNAFHRCKALKSVTLPEGITIIGSHAFSECIGLKGITIPESVTSIGNHAFSACNEINRNHHSQNGYHYRNILIY